MRNNQLATIIFRAILISIALMPLYAIAQDLPQAGTIVQTSYGPVEGSANTDGVSTFLGIPYAASPVGELRWRAPQPHEPWSEARPAHQFGARCMQAGSFFFRDIVFRSEGMSEDCLFLNVWTPKPSGAADLPVLLYFHGGGFIAGDGSEPRYDGAAIAREGAVVVTMNYRLGIFGFLSHSALSDESDYGTSGNYGLLDQTAALEWIRDNISAFGGDPNGVTIAGESAGSVSVSAHMVSPLSSGLFNRAIGESGSLLGTLPPADLAKAEESGVRFAESVGAESLAELRAMSAENLLAEASKPGVPWFTSTIDGHFFAGQPVGVFEEGDQAHVPLLVGWNAEEMTYRLLFMQREPSPESYAEIVRGLYPDNADEVLSFYPGETQEQVIASATQLAGDRFIAYSTWKWSDLHRQTGEAPVFRYYFTQERPALKNGGFPGAVHSAEIEYALGNLDTDPGNPWTEDDYAVSKTMMGYFVNFIKAGDPNGPGLPEWPPAADNPDATSEVMVIGVDSRSVPDAADARYRFLDRLSKQ